MLTTLSHIILYPIQTILEVLFNCFYTLTSENIIQTTFFISFFISLICLPFYNQAEKFQQEERAIQDKMADKVKLIKRNFKGDEQFMILSAYYRQNNYHPIMAFRGIFSLLIQIPFFMAAYIFFSHVTTILPMENSVISNLTFPDGLISVFGLKINLLPILMTVINIISCEIYFHNRPWKERIQPYLTALIFLVLLYNSPALLVIYWTFNNLFSLIKNIILRQEKPLVGLYQLLGAIFVTMILIALPNFNTINILVVSFVLIYLLIFSIIFIKFVFKNYDKFFGNISVKNADVIFSLSTITLFLLVGAVISTKVTSTDVLSFYFSTKFVTVYKIIFLQLLHSAGIFIFWIPCMYMFTNKSHRAFVSVLYASIALFAVINFLIFTGDFGSISNTFCFQSEFILNVFGSNLDKSINILSLIILISLVYFLFRYDKLKFLYSVFSILILSEIVLSIINFSSISHIVNQKRSGNSEFISDFKIPLTKSGKNVIVIFLDRATGVYLPYALKERPSLNNTYSGFTFYPNTLSLYDFTILAYPAMMGGYEYTPLKLNAQNRLMKDKHNEAISVLPTLFQQNNYNVTLTDFPFVDYHEVSSKSFFTKKNFNYENLIGKFNNKSDENDNTLNPFQLVNNIARNMLFYSFMEISPNFAKESIYNYGNYFSIEKKNHNDGNAKVVMDNYYALFYLPKLTTFESKKNAFVVINNVLTHTPHFMNYPKYDNVIDSEDETNTGNNVIGSKEGFKTYHVFISSIISVGRYLDYLKENGVYDNSKIIIISDHGDFFGRGIAKYSSEQNRYIIPYNPLLMVKDFNANGILKTDKKLMTNADLPLLATENLIKNPKNPFTNKVLVSEKKDGVYLYLEHTSRNLWHLQGKKKCIIENDVNFLKIINSDIFDKNNWIFFKKKNRDLPTE